MSPISKKYLVIDHAGRPINADANFVSKMSRRDQDMMSPVSGNDTIGSTAQP